MHEHGPRKLGTPLSPKETAAHLRLQQQLMDFSRLFDYDEPNDRAIAVVGPAFLDAIMTQILVSFLVDDENEVQRLLQPEGPLGTLGAKVTACYCLGLIGETIKSDLRLVTKIRNRFAHDLGATFEDERIKSWCLSLRWHRVAMFRDPPNEATARDHFQVGVNQLVCHLNSLPTLALNGKRQKAKSGTE